METLHCGVLGSVIMSFLVDFQKCKIHFNVGIQIIEKKAMLLKSLEPGELKNKHLCHHLLLLYWITGCCWNKSNSCYFLKGN